MSEKNDIPDVDFDLAKEMYEHTNNPLYIWDYIHKHASKTSLPSGITDYLKNVAEKLLSINKPDDKAAYLIKNALGFYNAKVFSAFHKAPIKLKVYHRVIQERVKGKPRLDGEDEFSIVGNEFCIDRETVRKYYYEIKADYDVIKEEEEKLFSST